MMIRGIKTTIGILIDYCMAHVYALLLTFVCALLLTSR